MVSPDDLAQASLTIDDTLIAGTMGVNRFSGPLGDALPFGQLATTRMAGPPTLMRQEDILLDHLHQADTVEVIGDGMSMSRDGLLLVELERSGTKEQVSSS